MTQSLPQRVRVLILGGGIHGVGVLHDLASRGWKDILLVEKSKLGSGTSAHSTKLIHGGLRYLKHLRDYGLVSEALKERDILQKLAPDLVYPIELYLPVLKKGGMPSFILRMGLGLYDFLAGKHRIHRHQVIKDKSSLDLNVPLLDQQQIKKVLSFWDMQMDDAELVHRVAQSARNLGAQIHEDTKALKMKPTQDGWDVEVKSQDGTISTISARFVFNAMGPWAHDMFSASNIAPKFKGVNSKGAHLVLDDLGHKVGMFLQSPDDERIFFMLPWMGKTLIGTTEDKFDKHPDELTVTEKDVKYLLERCNRYLNRKIKESDIKAVFSGLRWLQVDEDHDLGSTTRAYAISEHQSGRGILYTLYGGKYTTYRNLSKLIGDKISHAFGDFQASRTDEKEMWATPGQYSIDRNMEVTNRFELYKIQNHSH